MTLYYNPILKVFEPENKTAYLKKGFISWNEVSKSVKLKPSITA